MAVLHIHSYLVHAGRTSEHAHRIGGAAVPLQGKLFDLLNDIYVGSDDECDIEIAFSPNEDGEQDNPCRDLIVGYLGDPTLARGRRIAARLEAMTDGRSGLGLLFLISGREGRDHKIVLSRFPTDSAILADEDQTSLTVSFLERVFMKNRNSYKAVPYRNASLRTDFWIGYAVDKQINAQFGEYPNYWIAGFLNSDFTVTPAAGTRRLANALREAAKRAPVDVKREIVAAATLATGLRGQRISIAEFGNRYRFSLSPAARRAIREELKPQSLANEQFRFDEDEFTTLVPFRSVELDNGGMMTAPSVDFDDVFQREVIDSDENEVRFSTQGRVVDEKLKKVR